MANIHSWINTGVHFSGKSIQMLLFWKIISIHWLELSLHVCVSKVGLCIKEYFIKDWIWGNGKEGSIRKVLGRTCQGRRGGGGGGGGGFCEAERQHGGDTSVAVLTFSPLEPGCQHKPLGPDSSQTPELKWRNKGCFPLSSLFPSATVFSLQNTQPALSLHPKTSTTFYCLNNFCKWRRH